jgi:hypothetical protein
MMRKPDGLDSILRRQVETVPQFNHSTDNRGMGEFSAVLGCPLIGSDHVVLPEVNTGAKPVIILSAGLKRRTAQEFLGGFEIASVIGKD